ncbi:MAG: DUF3341 domain-containing protein [Dehalococcoidia bacterium]|nr:DUF3341 domain-containing protein [Dehalococcoidia bacterium]
MAKRAALGLYKDALAAATAVDNLKQNRFTDGEIDILSGTPYPEGAFGEHHIGHKLFVFPFIGAACGFSVGLLLTLGTQLSYPMVTGGKPILSVPPMAIIMYEGTMLGAILFTILGILFESRLPRVRRSVYDGRITEGYVGVRVECEPQRFDAALNALRQAGADDVKFDNQPGLATT